MGLAVGHKEGVMQVAKYKVNWEFKGESELKGLYDRLIGYLGVHKYGEYFAMKEVFGKEVARRLVKKGDIIGPASDIRS